MSNQFQSMMAHTAKADAGWYGGEAFSAGATIKAPYGRAITGILALSATKLTSMKMMETHTETEIKNVSAVTIPAGVKMPIVCEEVVIASGSGVVYFGHLVIKD